LYTIERHPDVIIVLLGEPRPNGIEQSRILQEARDLAYSVWVCNVVQRPIGPSTRLHGWILVPNLRHPNPKGIKKWLEKHGKVFRIGTNDQSDG
jgi:hypothetical protein